jgi:hypothetical protein
VSVFRAQQKEEHTQPVANYTLTQHKPPTEVAEKALKGKAISHGVAFGDQQILTRTSKETYDLDGPNNPIGVFVFKYRSRGKATQQSRKDGAKHLQRTFNLS